MLFTNIVLASSVTVLLLDAQSSTNVRTQVVKSAPFTAQAITQSSKTLADGNRIVKSTTSFVARDSEGRTRKEQQIGHTSSQFAFINDPISGKAYVIETQEKSVREIQVQTADVSDATAQAVLEIESLGTKLIESFQAEGTRLKQIIPGNSEGNAQSIEVVSETWYCPQLKTVISRRTLDPRQGEITFHLTGIQLREPDPSNFIVPDGYKTKQ